MALLASQIFIAPTLVYNPHLGQVVVYEMWGQPFGAGHAVPNFCRLAETEWLSRALG